MRGLTTTNVNKNAVARTKNTAVVVCIALAPASPVTFNNPTPHVGCCGSGPIVKAAAVWLLTRRWGPKIEIADSFLAPELDPERAGQARAWGSGFLRYRERARPGRGAVSGRGKHPRSILIRHHREGYGWAR